MNFGAYQPDASISARSDCHRTHPNIDLEIVTTFRDDTNSRAREYLALFKSAEHAVPRFFFDFVRDHTLNPDGEGQEMAGISEARREAVETLHELARGMLSEGDERELILLVRDEAGRTVLKAGLRLRLQTL